MTIIKNKYASTTIDNLRGIRGKFKRQGNNIPKLRR